MGVIDLSYDKNLVQANVYSDYILLNDKMTMEIIYKFPFPKGFSLLGTTDTYYGESKPTFIVAPYNLEYPKYIPSGYGNVHLAPCGLYRAEKKDEKNKDIYYIETSFLTSEDYEFPSSGKFKIKESEIPSSFWVSVPNFGKGCKASKVEETVKKFNSNARLIYEEELMSIYALQDYKCSFFEHISEETYFSLRQMPKFVLEIGNYSLDNLMIVASSRENRKVYREMAHFWKRNSDYNQLWYINRSFTEKDKENYLNNIYVYSVLEDNKKEDSMKLKKVLK